MQRKTPIIFLLTFVLVLVFSINTLGAINLPLKPTQNIYIQDYAQMLSETTEKAILEQARMLDEKTTAQIAVVTINSLEGNPIEEYANELFRGWGIGNQEKNNGILLLVAKDDRAMRIEVGYGLEGRINDGKAGSIIRDMGSYFQSGDFDNGVILAYNTLASEVSEEYGVEVNALPGPVKSSNERLSFGMFLIYVFFGIVIASIIYTKFGGGGGRGGGSSRGGGYRGRNIGGGPFIGGGFGGFGRGSGGSGGFGGFGGGSSGGGGASGRW